MPTEATTTSSSGLDVNKLLSELEVPFSPDQVRWRVTNTTNDRKRGQIVPYADSRAYTDRLNALFTPHGWTREYKVETMTNITRVKKGESIVSGIPVRGNWKSDCYAVTHLQPGNLSHFISRVCIYDEHFAPMRQVRTPRVGIEGDVIEVLPVSRCSTEFIGVSQVIADRDAGKSGRREHHSANHDTIA